MLTHQKSLNSVLIKPAGPECNMSCEYCFYLKKSGLFTDTSIHRMNEEILEELVKQVMNQSSRQVSFLWQGGEPTLMGLSFFQKVIEFQQKYGRGHTVGNGIQTNGILIDKNWAKFFKNYYFLVGISMDGPQHIHDKYRHMKDGSRSWSKVESSVKLLLDYGVNVNALILFNDYSVQFPEQIYQYHKSLGLNFMQFIPCVETDEDRILPFSVNPENYGKALIKLFDLWISDFTDGYPATSIRFFDSVFHTYVNLMPPECTLMQECGIYVVIEHNGNVYSCDFFVDDKWKLGNIKEKRILEMLNSETQNEFGYLKVELPDECINCKWLKHCRGGCPKDRILNVDSGKLNYLCPAFKMFFKHSDKKFKELAAKWKKENEIKAQKSVKEEDKKPGRNEPCPCGSGSKFKYCCGKK